MIPNAMATTGPAAEEWSHWKSIDHALERALSYERADQLSELDRDRLAALHEHLSRALALHRLGSAECAEAPSLSDIPTPAYGRFVDIKEELDNIAEFRNWKSASHRSFVGKLQSLIDALEKHAVGSGENRFCGPSLTQDDRDVFRLLRAIARSFLLPAEAAL